MEGTRRSVTGADGVRIGLLTAGSGPGTGLLLVHGGNDTNVPVNESVQMYDALRERDRTVRYLVFPDDGHEIAKRENRATLAVAVRDWLTTAFAAARVP